MFGYKVKLWIGSIIFAFGIFWWTWFLRNALRAFKGSSRVHTAKLYTDYNPVIHIIWNTLWVALGLWIYPEKNFVPIIPLVVGVILGLLFSR